MKYLYALYLGFSLAAFADMSIWQWEYYAIVIPTVILVTRYNRRKI